MDVIARNTEQHLLDDIYEYKTHHPFMRFAYCRFSELEQELSTWFDLVVEAAEKSWDDQGLCLYICDDSDVFISGRMLSYRTLEKFLAHLTPKLTPAPLTELAALFEVGVDAGRLQELAQSKIEESRIQRMREEKQGQEKTLTVSRERALQALDEQLLGSLDKRREKRDMPQILVVEDDIFSQKLVQNALSSYALSVCGDGQGAIMGYVAKAPDILFLDIGLPDMNGHEVLEKIFKIDPRAYVVMFSANGSRDNILKALELGAKGFVGKPFTQEKLIQYINKSPHIISKRKDAPHGHSIH